jgi:hypothetical protein
VGINEIYICDNTFSDSCLFEIDTSLDIQNFGINYSLEIDEIADFNINLDFLNDISFCENDANCINSVNSTLINIIYQYSEKKVGSSIVNGTDGENSNEYGSNQIVLNSNSEENVLYSNDTSVSSNHVVIDVNRSIVCNEIETSVTNVNFKYDFNMLNILYVNCCSLVNKLHYPEFENLIEKHNIVCFVETKTDDMNDEIKLPGYKFHMKNRKTNSRVKSGGIIIGYQEQFHKNIEVHVY